MCTLATELGGTLRVGKSLIADGTKIEIGRRARGMLNLAFKRIEPIRKLLDIAEVLVNSYLPVK